MPRPMRPAAVLAFLAALALPAAPARADEREVRPWRYHAVERQVTLPGFWAVICADPSESDGAGVITRAEYEEYLRDAQR